MRVYFKQDAFFKLIQKYYILISNSQTKLITSLKQKKYRDREELFVAEGPKVISELLEEGFIARWVFSTAPSNTSQENHFAVTNAELKKISFLTTPNTSLAVFEIPTSRPVVNSGLIVALDALRDPGNLGTIIRLCDWFGVAQLICSEDTVDCYNPKVVQASMGSLARVAINYLPLPEYLHQTELPIYGGFMDGKSVYSESLPKNAILVLGNEANGISETISAKIGNRISIPRFGELQKTESLNVAAATAILLSEFRRSTGK